MSCRSTSCKKIKDYTENRVLTGAFYGYVNFHAMANRGHFGLGNILYSKAIDFIATTNDHDPAGVFSSMVDSIKLAGKLYIYEGDVRTSLTNKLGDNMPWADADNTYYKRGIWLGPDKQTSVANLKRTSADVMREKHPEEIIKRAVWGMMPHGRLGRAQFAKLKVFGGAMPEHNFAAQNAQPLELK